MRSTSPVSLHRRFGPLILGGILLSATSYYAGRFSARSNPARSLQGQAASITATVPLGAFAAASRSAVPFPPSAPGQWDETHWTHLQSSPGTQARTIALAQLLETLAASDPARALALAQAESNGILRDQLVQAALRGWAKSAPADAAHWALTLLNPGAREAALNAVFSGAVAANPDEAVRVAQSLIANNPGEGVSYGGHLIDALCDAGNFVLAASVATTGDTTQRSFWVGEAYAKWASFQPQQAAQAAAALSDPAIRTLALHGLVGGWSEADPAATVQFVTQLPPGADDSSLLSQALQRWTKVDLKAASDWLNHHEATPAMDAGVASVATRDYLPPDVAVSWAESVVDPKLRSETLVSVLRGWATTDLAAATRYFNASENLTPDDRREVAGLIATLSGSPQP